MKILHVISGLTKGGGQRVVVELANTAIKNGDEVTIVAGWSVDPELMQNLLTSGVNIRFIGRTNRDAYLKMIPWIFTNRKWMCSFDVIHSHLTMGSVIGSVASVIFKMTFQKKVPVSVETYHAVGMPIPEFNRWVHSRLMLFRNGVAFMAKDPYWDKFIAKHRALRTAIIPNGMSVPELQKGEAAKLQWLNEFNIPANGSFIVGTVGMLRPERKPELYIPIFKAINNAMGNRVHFILAGDGEDLEKIKKLVADSGINENIHMPGVINDPAFAISNMDIYVSVSVGESVGMSMIEAAMCNVPVVGIQFVENYQSKETDWVWSHTDTGEVAKKIIFLLQNTDERNTLAKTQNEFARANFSSAAMYASYNTFYNNCR